jgi:hypothetical protein
MFRKFDGLGDRQATGRLRSMCVALACMCSAFIGAEAAAPQLKNQAPGFYRMMLGDFEITALSDGVFELKTNEMLTNATAKSRELLTNSFHGDTVTTSVNAYLVNMGDLVAGAHLPFPGIGHVRAERVGYTWLPIDYGAVP